jgi:hypothetical protein
MAQGHRLTLRVPRHGRGESDLATPRIGCRDAKARPLIRRAECSYNFVSSLTKGASVEESEEPREEGLDLTLAQAVERPEALKTPDRIEAKLDAAARPYERFDDLRPEAKPPEKGR